MPFSSRTTTSLTCLSGVGSIFGFCLGVLAWSRSSAVRLPLPAWLLFVITVLSPVVTATLIVMNMTRSKALDKGVVSWNNVSLRDITASFVLKSQSILEIAVAIVVLSRNNPQSILRCYIEGQWQSYFQAKDSDAIRMIQDSFQCCGLRSVHDRAWPFKDSDHGDNACNLQLGYRRSCLLPWEEQQRIVSSMVIVAALMSWSCRIILIQVLRKRRSWMHGGYLTFTSPAVDQRLSHPEPCAGGVDNEEVPDAPVRAILPQSTANASAWD